MAGESHFDERRAAVRRLATVFFISLVCLDGTSNLVSFVYDSIGLYNLGQANTFSLYFGFFLSNFIAKRMLAWFADTHRAIFTGFLFYGLAILASIWTYSCYYWKLAGYSASPDFLRPLNLASNFLLGFFGATLVWSGQYQYIDRISSEAEKSELFSVFYTYFQFCGVSYNLINILLYSLDLSSLYCFSLFFLGLNISNFALLWVVPAFRGYSDGKPPESLAGHKSSVIEAAAADEKLLAGSLS